MDHEQQTGAFAAGKPAAISNSQPASAPASVDQDGDRSQYRFAGVLVWVLRGLALMAVIWGTLNAYHVWNWSRVAQEWRKEIRALPGGAVLDDAESTAVFAAIVLAASSMTVLLALSEGLRLCIAIERNTRRAGESQSNDEDKQRTSGWVARL